jgi:hypothetical protein
MPHRRLFKKTDTWEYGFETRAHEQPLEAPKKRRALTTVLFAAAFFAGAAFAAFAGDQLAQVNSDASSAGAVATSDATASDATASDPTATPDATSPDAASTADPSSDPTAAAPATSDTSTASATPDAGAAETADPNADAQPDYITPARGSSSTASAASTPSTSPTTVKKLAAGKPRPGGRANKQQVRALLVPKSRPAPPPEVEGPAQNATIWLNSPLPDPTPPAVRLSTRFARHLRMASTGVGVNWALVLAILRARGLTGHNPADKGTLVALSKRLASIERSVQGDWATALAYGGTPTFADKVQALARYDRAVGLDALVTGLESVKQALGQKLLSDPSIQIYAGGRNDIANNKVDVRVLALISYLHEAFGEVTVSCLISGHRLYARPGVVSAHIFGRAVDIAALGGTSILGHQQPGGVTEQAVRDILLLPSEDMPKQVISLLGLGGPSFPLADHYNHIHVGY